ncbi:alpha-ketoglutarate-dependent dioxygenase AlkB family protein [Erythrobacter aureus]|nr:alpha-ketoglutarate-dependent dioxygenase AlkB [Erythrobacter aureus]
MQSLFTSQELVKLNLPGADVRYQEHLEFGRSAGEIFDDLVRQISWKHEDITIHGKTFKQPRLTAWYGDPGMSYTYSGLSLAPLAWPALLLELKRKVEEVTQQTYNSALLNQYRGHRDSVGFHADDEPELGRNPTIASLSFGETREFVLKPKRGRPGQTTRLPLASGSLLVMAGETQQNWLHGVEKLNAPCGGRVNITFRNIVGQRRGRFAR